MGELRGGRPDQPEEQPEPRDNPARTSDRPRLSPDPDSNNNPEAIRRAMKASDAFAPRGDRPTHRAPDIEPPSGKELLEKDAPEASRADRFRKRGLDQETLADEMDAFDQWGDIAEGALSPPGPTHAGTQCKPLDIPTMTSPPHGIDVGDTLTAMFVTGILLGEGARRAYRKASELKEKVHARHG